MDNIYLEQLMRGLSIDGEECKEISLTGGDEIDNPLVTKYCELDHPASLKFALRHSVNILDSESFSSG